MADSDGLLPARVPKLAEVIAANLRRQIVRGELAEGDALPSESELLDRFQVSRPTLREAFRVLESESLISVRRGAGGGARVHVPDSDLAARYAGFILEYQRTPLFDLFEARILIEPAIVASLTETRTDADIARLRAALVELEATVDDPVLSIRAHSAFHALLVELAGNQTLRVLTDMIDHIIERATWQTVASRLGTAEHAALTRKGLRAHHRVVDLIEAGVRAGAEEVWRKLLTEARDYLLLGDVSTVLDLGS